jgi:hypothetical protein
MKTLAAIAAAIVILVTPRAQAQQDTVQDSPRRAVPDYDGRGAEPAPDPGLWVPRVLLSPLYFTSEYVLRRPLGAITIAAERGKVPERLYDFLAFGPDHKIGFAPVGLVEFGFNPSVGIWGFWDDALVKKNHVRLHVEVWPDDWYAETLTDRWELDSRNTLQLRGAAFKRPDQVFYGLGPESAQYHQSRFTEAELDASAMIQSYVWRSTRFEARGGLRKVDLSPGHYGSDPSLEAEARTGAFPLPYGFGRGYTAPYGRALASFDTRARNATTGSGVRIEAQAEGGEDVEQAPASGWIRYGGSATIFVDLNDHGRVLSLTGAAAFSDPLGDRSIPFTELVMLGGDNWMHGFFPGRLRDRSAGVVQLEYTWPVAPWLSGAIQGAVGNVFGVHLDGFDPKLLRVSAGIGLTVSTKPPIALLVGFGTDTIDRGATPESFRVSVGVPRLF